MADPVSGSHEVVHVPHGEVDVVSETALSSRQIDELASVGFSPAFPGNLRILNEALSSGLIKTPQSLQGYRFTLTPDNRLPSVEVVEKRWHPYEVIVDAETANKTATLRIRDKAGYVEGSEKPAGNIATTKVTDLQRFAEQYPTNATVMFRAKQSNPFVDVPGGDNRITEIPLADVHSVEQLEEEMGVSPRTYMHLLDLEIGFEHVEPPEVGLQPVSEKLWISLGYQALFNSGHASLDRFNGEPVFTLRELFAEGPSASIEHVIGLFAVLVETPLD